MAVYVKQKWGKHFADLPQSLQKLRGSLVCEIPLEMDSYFIIMGRKYPTCIFERGKCINAQGSRKNLALKILDWCVF